MARVLLVVKRSRYRIFGLDRKDPDFLHMLSANPVLAAEVLAEHDENERSADAVRAWLTGNGVWYEERIPGEQVREDNYSLVVTVGGDGTLLKASHLLTTVPVLGINSRPGFSVGHFCKTDAAGFVAELEAILEGRAVPRELARCLIHVNGEPLGPPALNDVLFSSANPAAVTEYSIRMGGNEELQKSSGIWISTAAGSTAAALSAGGMRMPMEARVLQFVVREVYRNRRNHLSLLKASFEQGLEILNLTFEAGIFMDGGFVHRRLCYGDLIQPALAPEGLRIFL
jgi:NAD+ kinase